MAKLTARARKALPASDFAGGKGKYLIPDVSHARNALARVANGGSADLAGHEPKLPERLALLKEIAAATPPNILGHVRWDLVAACIRRKDFRMMYTDPEG